MKQIGQDQTPALFCVGLQVFSLEGGEVLNDFDPVVGREPPTCHEHVLHIRKVSFVSLVFKMHAVGQIDFGAVGVVKELHLV